MFSLALLKPNRLIAVMDFILLLFVGENVFFFLVCSSNLSRRLLMRYEGVSTKSVCVLNVCMHVCVAKWATTSTKCTWSKFHVLRIIGNPICY